MPKIIGIILMILLYFIIQIILKLFSPSLNQETEANLWSIPLQPGDKNRSSKSIPENTEDFLYEYLRSSPEFRFLSAEYADNKG